MAQNRQNSRHRVDPADVPADIHPLGAGVLGRSGTPVASWAGYARRCGATGIGVTSRDQLDEAMGALLTADGPKLLCVQQDAELL